MRCVSASHGDRGALCVGGWAHGGFLRGWYVGWWVVGRRGWMDVGSELCPAGLGVIGVLDVQGSSSRS